MNLTTVGNISQIAPISGYTSINIIDTYKDICTGMDGFVYKGIIMIFIFYLSARVILPSLDKYMKFTYKGKPLYESYMMISNFYFSLCETLALGGITLILIMYNYHTYGRYYDPFLIGGIVFVILAYLMTKKLSRLEKS